MSQDEQKLSDQNERQCEGIYLKVDGEIIPIKDLPKHEYEDFLEFTHKLRMAYFSTINEK